MSLPFPKTYSGKVRDIYRLEDGLLFVASDRLSAFDVVFRQPIADKGKVLTQLTEYWVDKLSAAKPFHARRRDLASLGLNDAQLEELRGRSMCVEGLEMLPVEAVVRGHILGSGWKDYRATGCICGIRLPQGLQKGDKLPEAVFTPATKAAVGDHDENIDFDRVVELVGESRAEEVRTRALEIFSEARALAWERGYVLVDTKLEFGLRQDGTLVLADEVLTPDSSRYWRREDWESRAPGEVPPSFDKQLVRDYLETLDWNKEAPGPAIPQEILDATRARYLELFKGITGEACKI